LRKLIPVVESNTVPLVGQMAILNKEILSKRIP